MLPSRIRPLIALALICSGAGLAAVFPVAAGAAPGDDDTPVLLTPKGEREDGSDEQSFDKLRDAYYWSRLLSGDEQLTVNKAAKLRSKAVVHANGISKAAPAGTTRGGDWLSQGPDPIVQVGRTSNTFEAVSGRIGALAIRNDGTIILGAAQGGVWTYDPASGTWTPRSNATDTQSVGALAIAPSNDQIVYMGSGEGALSGDSYYGDGFYRSTNGGVTWQHVSTLFTGQAVSAIAVDPTDPQHVYAATVRGRGGAHRTTSPTAKPYGVYESTDGGSTWTLRKGTTDEIHGATDLVMDPQDPTHLWASFWGDGIYKSTDGGKTWSLAMTGLPDGNFLEGGTRFSLGISHPAGSGAPTLYTGFDYFDQSDAYHPGSVFKSTDGGDTWAATATGTGTNSIRDYCGTQCFYDNVVKPDPTNPDIVYVARLLRIQLQPTVGWRLPLDRRRRDLEEPRLRPAPRLPCHRRPGQRHLAHRHRERRRNLGVAHPRWSQRGGRSPLGSGLAEPQRPGRPEHGGPRPLHRPGHRPVQLHGDSARTSPASTGAAPRTTGPCASPSPTTDGSTSRAVTAVRSSSTRRRRTTATRRCRHTSSAPTSASRRTASTPRRPTPSSGTRRSTAASISRTGPSSTSRGCRTVGTSTRCSSARTGSTGPTTRRPRAPRTSPGSRSAPISPVGAPVPRRTVRVDASSRRSASPTAATVRTSGPTRAGSRSAPTP